MDLTNIYWYMVPLDIDVFKSFVLKARYVV